MKTFETRIARLERAAAEKRGDHCIPMVIQEEGETREETIARAKAVGGTPVVYVRPKWVDEYAPETGVTFTDSDGVKYTVAEWLAAGEP